MMPKMDGFTVLSKIRAEGYDVPVIMLTAKAETDDKINGLDLGADDYLAKPFETKELLARIRAITRRKSEAVSTEMKYGDCTLNSLNYELIWWKRKAAEQGISDHGTADGKSECDNISRAYDGEDMGL